jgi:hypothetical protein
MDRPGACRGDFVLVVDDDKLEGLFPVVRGQY